MDELFGFRSTPLAQLPYICLIRDKTLEFITHTVCRGAVNEFKDDTWFKDFFVKIDMLDTFDVFDRLEARHEALKDLNRSSQLTHIELEFDRLSIEAELYQ